MSDADGKIIPHVEDDQGEGIKDFYNQDDLIQQMERLDKGLIQETLEKGKSDSEMLQLIFDKIETLDRKIELIFGGHKLINGRWIKLEPPEMKRK